MGASEQTGDAASPDLTPDPATTQGPVEGPDAVSLVGYVGEGCSDDSVRLYQSVALNRWLEIASAVIIARVPAPDGDGQSVVWVQRDATLALCESVRASDYESAAGPEEQLKWPRP
jgi:hypothetical protein